MSVKTIIVLVFSALLHQLQIAPFMKKLLRNIIGCILLMVFAVQNLSAQQAPFSKEILEFKKQDSIHFPPQKAILFIGSSSFTKWKDVQGFFPGHRIINRGFGGSSLPDLIQYTNDVIIPYQPKQIVVYCGDNDLASSDTVQPLQVLQRFQQLFSLIRKQYPKVRIAYVSIKPSPRREKLQQKMEATNALIYNFLKSKKRTDFIDIYHPMLLPNGKPDPSLFIEDNLHMNAKGYAIWQKIIEPFLIKDKS
jgi:lysophospholipase L1-like esterase